nr:CRISPR-associated endonuclease Cas3'' [Derxia lacustris]
MAAQFAQPFDSAQWASFAGLWHDLGKYRAGFQRYLRQNPDAHIEQRTASADKTHSAAGALWAESRLIEMARAAVGAAGANPRQQADAERQARFVARVLQYLIAGHHAGLDDWSGDTECGQGLCARLQGADAQRELVDALAGAEGIAPPDAVLRPDAAPPAFATLRIEKPGEGEIPGRFALWVRMLFSALVDADFLDTERYMDGGKSARRAGFKPLPQLLEAFDAKLAQKLADTRADGLAETAVNRVRADVLAQCRERAAEAPGAWSLSVPTGGGKTLSSLAFALGHAVRHGKRRVIYAIPYTSIIEQTAEVFRGIFGAEQIVEHHSGVEVDETRESAHTRLACENWDAPLVVTTNVQLFESLFARRTSRCRKLHNLAGSVIVLDEAQALPPAYLQPIVDVLRLLIRDYGVTVLFCTATQPVLTSPALADVRKGLKGFAAGEVREIVRDPAALHRALRRVRVQLPANLNQPRGWAELADEIAAHDAVLAVVGRRADAAELYRQLKSRAGDDDSTAGGLWHLSALMCAQHRADVLGQIRAALAARRAALAAGRPALPVRIASTQLIEAGVDLDLPVVYRALAGLDSIAQAAGRCNREGLLAEGVVHVFVPPKEPPPGVLRRAVGKSRLVWAGEPADPLAPELVSRYFGLLYNDEALDAKDMRGKLRAQPDLATATLPVRFRSASDAFRLIDEADGGTVFVRYPAEGVDAGFDAMFGALEAGRTEWGLLRKLQRHTVTLYRHHLLDLLARGDVREVPNFPGLYVQASDTFYDPALGVIADGAPGDPAALVF